MKRIALAILIAGMFFGASVSAHASISGGPGGGSTVVGATATPNGTAGWTVTANGTVHATGAAHYYGGLSGVQLHAAVVGIAAVPSGSGYWLLAADGGVFSFGSARFYGSTGAIHLNQPIVGMSATADGRGYWLVARDGGIFAFGDAPFDGSTAGSCVGVVGIIPTTSGYIIAGADGSLRQMTASTASAAKSTCASSACPASFTSTVAASVNSQRAAAHLAPLNVQSQLTWAANQRSITQATTNTMSHDGWDTVIAASGYPSTGYLGENVAAGFNSPQDVMSGWMGSPDHRTNILNPHYTDIGIGCAYSTSHTAYWTQDFGGPA